MVNKKLNFVLLFTLVAIVAHFYLTTHFNGLKYGTSTNSFCNISSTFNCDTTSASSFAQIFNIPIALFGLVANLIFFGWVAFARLSWADERELLLRYSFYFSIFIASVSIVMGTLSSFVLKSLCPFCLLTYFMSFLNLGILWHIHRSTKINIVSDIKRLFKDHKSILILIILIPIIAYILNDMMVGQAKQIDKIAQSRVQDWTQETSYSFTTDGLSLGADADKASLHIVEFADFRCPHCKFAAPSLHAFTKAHPDVRFTFKPFPLDGTCNKAITGGGDGISCELAAMTFCAEAQGGKGFQVHDYIFEQQQNILSLSNLESIYKEIENNLKIPAEQLKTCASSQETLSRIQQMAQEGSNAKVEGTPTVYINGKKLLNGHMLPILEEAYKTIKK